MSDITFGFTGSGCIASRVIPTPAIANTETSVISAFIEPNSLTLGSVFRLNAWGIATNTTTASTSIFKIKYGGVIIGQQSIVNVTTTRTNMPIMVQGIMTIQATGLAGKAIGTVYPLGGSTGTAPGTGLTVIPTIDTTQRQLLEFTFQSGAASTTAIFHSATIEALKW